MNIQTYLDYKAKFDRMSNILGKYTMELNAEQMKPLIDDGFDCNSVENFWEQCIQAQKVCI